MAFSDPNQKRKYEREYMRKRRASPEVGGRIREKDRDRFRGRYQDEEFREGFQKGVRSRRQADLLALANKMQAERVATSKLRLNPHP